MISNVYPSLCPVVQDLVHLRQSSLFEGHSVFMMFKCLEIPWTKISQPFFCTASTAFGHTGRFDSHQRCHLCRETSGERVHYGPLFDGIFDLNFPRPFFWRCRLGLLVGHLPPGN